MKKSISTATTSSSSSGENAQQNYLQEEISFSRFEMIPQRLEFTTWLKALSLNQRYVGIHVKNVKMIEEMKKSYKKVERLEEEIDWNLPSSNNKTKGFPKSIKVHSLLSKILFESLIFLSVNDYLDTIGFDLNKVESLDRLYDILVPKSLEGQCFSQYSFQTVQSKEQWGKLTIQFLQYLFLQDASSDLTLLVPEKTKNKQLACFWKNLSEIQKSKILLLGSANLQQLFLLLKTHQIDLQPFAVKDQVKLLIKMDHDQFCNRILKSKLRNSTTPFHDYYQHIYHQWKEQSEKKKRKLKKKKIKKERKKSVGSLSDKTDHTQHKSINVHSLAMERVQSNLLQFYDNICKQVNKFHERRVIAFERIQTLFWLYQCPIKLFGSCANGIAIKSSDIDIVIDKVILNNFQYVENPQTQMLHALQFFQDLFKQIPWIVKTNFIKTAKIPIIKLIIDTSIPVREEYINEFYRQSLNRNIDNHGLVEVDITIETFNHLGLISTEAINKWLEEIPTLRIIVVLLKCYLAKHSLNESYSCGLNTYSLMVMIVGYIYDAELAAQTRISMVLQKILKFYGWQFDEKTTKVDIRNKNNIFQKKKFNPKSAELQLCDPLNDGNIMTRNCYKFHEIKQLFRTMWKKCIYEVETKVEEIVEESKQINEEEVKEILLLSNEHNYFLEELN